MGFGVCGWPPLKSEKVIKISQNKIKTPKFDQKKWLKNDQKITILNGKIEKSVKNSEKWLKMSENHEKWQKKGAQISHKELTPSKCLPWERTTVRKRGQKRALSLRYPLQNWKTRKNSEKSCFHQKWQKIKKHQKCRNRENQKKWKSRKSKIRKSDKTEKWKMMKKVSKMHTPPKTPKCHLNGQNRHFVKSEPPGPAFFRFQGVPRDPVLRPKSTPPFLNVKYDHIFVFLCFVICHFAHFCVFIIWWKVTFCSWHTFYDNAVHSVIRPYCNNWFIEGGRELLCGGSPLKWHAMVWLGGII